MSITAPGQVGRLITWFRAVKTLRQLALASVVANVLIVVTGGAVRLTGSGLGCPTWPRCTDDSLIPTRAYAAHGIIEFTNRQLTFVLSAVVIATLVSAILARSHVRWAVTLAASIPAQAVLGGVTVLTHLNPWAVAAHFLLSMACIAVAFTLWWQTARDTTVDPAPEWAVVSRSAVTALRQGALGLSMVTVAVLAIGTVVTGSGPHAGDKGATHRIHWAPSSVSQLHADVVMLLVGVTVGFVVLTRAVAAPPRLQRAAVVLLAIELAQGLIGFVQYFTGVPEVLVGIHMFGACLVWLAALYVVAVSRSANPRQPVRGPALSPARPEVTAVRTREEHRPVSS